MDSQAEFPWCDEFAEPDTERWPLSAAEAFRLSRAGASASDVRLVEATKPDTADRRNLVGFLAARGAGWEEVRKLVGFLRGSMIAGNRGNPLRAYNAFAWFNGGAVDNNGSAVFMAVAVRVAPDVVGLFRSRDGNGAAMWRHLRRMERTGWRPRTGWEPSEVKSSAIPGSDADRGA